SGGVRLDVGADVVAVFDGRGVVRRVGDAGRIGVGRHAWGRVEVVGVPDLYRSRVRSVPGSDLCDDGAGCIVFEGRGHDRACRRGGGVPTRHAGEISPTGRVTGPVVGRIVLRRGDVLLQA